LQLGHIIFHLNFFCWIESTKIILLYVLFTVPQVRQVYHLQACDINPM
jgi:hypothetical protein